MVNTSDRRAQPPEPFWSPVLKALRASLFFACHTAIAAVILICIWALSRLFPKLWGPDDPLLFDRVPLRYLFDALDLSVIVVFGWNTVRSAIAAFRK